jgi:hypothetical protein
MENTPPTKTHLQEGDDFVTFILLLVNKGLEANERHFPADFVNKRRGPCFLAHYNMGTKIARTLPILYQGSVSMPEKFVIASMKKLEVLLHSNLVETRSVTDTEKGIFPGGVKFEGSIFCFAGLHPRIDEACGIVACLWDNLIRADTTKGLILEIWEDEKICSIAWELFQEMRKEMPW